MNAIDTREALELVRGDAREAHALLARAHAVRIERRGMGLRLCGIVNAKSGRCTEDCAFCAQSAHHGADIACYPMIEPGEMVETARAAERNRASRFGIVTSGLALTEEAEMGAVASAVGRIGSELSIRPCASLGNLGRDALLRLKDAGLTRYHCNLETSERFFPRICTTRDWSDSVDTLRFAKEIGLGTCSGGIIGLGESPEERIALLAAIRSLDVDSVPLNFLHPIPGTPLENQIPLPPLECLKVVAIARLMMPDKEIRICGGREHALGDLQSWALLCGADALMIGNYLTTSGRDAADDLRMIEDAGFEIER